MPQVRALGAADTQRTTFADTWHRLAGSFAISEDTKPRVIDLDFPALPSGNGRTQKLIENGMEKITVGLCFVEANLYQTLSSPLFLIYSPQISLLWSTLLRLPTLLNHQPPLSPRRMRWMLSSKRPCTWTSNEPFRMANVHLMAISHYQMGLCSNDTNISAQVLSLHFWDVFTCEIAY